MLADDDDDDEQDDRAYRSSRDKGKGRSTRDQAITGFNERGVENLIQEKKAGPMVIQPLPNRDWRQSSHAKNARRPTYMPEGGQREVRPEDLVERSGDDVVRGGLQRVEASVQVESGDVPAAVTEDVDMVARSGNMEPAGTAASETLEQQALNAVLASANEDTSAPDMTIDLQSDTLNLLDRPPLDESDSFRQDVLTRPEESTMEDYSAVPIESFGAALLRGMGWNPGSGPNPKIHEPKRRPNGLGLGASEKPGSKEKGGKDDPSMSRAEKDKKRKEDRATRGGRGYVPVAKRARVSLIPGSTTSGTLLTYGCRHEQENQLDGPNSQAESSASSVVVRSRRPSRSPSPQSDASRRRHRDERDRSVTRSRLPGRSAPDLTDHVRNRDGYSDRRNGNGSGRERESDYRRDRERDRVDSRTDGRRDDRYREDRERNKGSSYRKEDDRYGRDRSSKYDSGRDRDRGDYDRRR